MFFFLEGIYQRLWLRGGKVELGRHEKCYIQMGAITENPFDGGCDFIAFCHGSEQ